MKNNILGALSHLPAKFDAVGNWFYGAFDWSVQWILQFIVVHFVILLFTTLFVFFQHTLGLPYPVQFWYSSTFHTLFWLSIITRLASQRSSFCPWFRVLEWDLPACWLGSLKVVVSRNAHPCMQLCLSSCGLFRKCNSYGCWKSPLGICSSSFIAITYCPIIRLNLLFLPKFFRNN